MGLTKNPYINLYAGTVTSGGVDGVLISETYQTSLTAGNLAGDTIITVASTTGFAVGMDILIGSEAKTIQSISGLQMTLTAALGSAHGNGETVINAGAGTAPFTIRISGAETVVQTFAVRCTTGYQADAGVTIITPTGADASRWTLSLDGTNFAAYGASITLPNLIDATNTLFYGKAKPLPSDTPQPDVSVKFQLVSAVSAV